MLDTDTKRRIDSARDILVGKVPDPKSQVEQITIALIYKFMDDMDAESEELGGKRKFFAKEFARYGWAKLLRAGLGGHDMLALYADGIAKMPENPGIPPLFRSIFKNAYLPYRDPETLKSFLKIIDEFSYDHSERLGDAFEYLLSVLGSQGDAGQFRTPRHIIDFMVEIVAPTKNETVLDPACGTAGFLISAYKHILRTNDPSDPSHPSAKPLTPDERGRLAKNFCGYDISPDMVRLSLVNLYLHGFNAPQIFEYDTLTSEERWNDHFDVILANPPFMSPKGGIKPHKRFSIQAKRSEVLFVDYMAEHLTPHGRAGIIVPEGIIFQSQTAYVELRKALVQNSLVAVVSLPAGCFNPYSGVKTSILILDKALAKQSDAIAFFKVENDGFGLGAQRRAVGGEQLTQVKAELAAYLHALRSRQPTDKLAPTCGLIAPKKQIAAKGDYNLSGERYRVAKNTASLIWPMVQLSSVCESISDGDHQPPPKASAGVPFVTISNIDDNNQLDFTKTYFVPESYYEKLSASRKPQAGDILYTVTGSYGIPVFVSANIKFCFQRHIALIRTGPQMLSRFLLNLLASPFMIEQGHSTATGMAQKTVALSSLRHFTIPLPPLEVQQDIVAEIEGYRSVIKGARAVLDHYRPHIPIHPNWPMVKLDSVSEWITKGTTPTTHGYKFTKTGISFIKIESINGDGEIEPKKVSFIDATCHAALKRSQLRENDILFSIAGTRMGITGFVTPSVLPANTNQALAIIRMKRDASPRFVFHYLRSDVVQNAIERLKVGVAQFNLSLAQVSEIAIPLPPVATQKAVVAEIEAEQKLVAANRELIARFEQKIQATLARVWGAAETAAGEVSARK